ncbi:MAG TPA: hypothetical protein PKE26_05400 [Kiritimatiellia bacterium]|nr:hypothetical protein [Kiritimatiellia bacterium]HMO98529.1 hypothetical protein [Kiritimatiellia bacterium]
MRSMVRGLGLMACGWWAAAPAALAQSMTEASAPQGVTVSIYDTGIGLINEARRATLTAGEQTLRLRGLPERTDPASVSYSSAARAAPFEVWEQALHFDLADTASLLRRMIGQPVVVAGDGKTREGVLLGPPIGFPESGAPSAFPVRSRDGNHLWMIGLDDLTSVTFPFGRDSLATEPQLVWRIRARQDGPQSFRLAYRTDGLSWRAHYDLLLAGDQAQADFIGRVEVDNRSGGRYDQARVRLLLTEKGLSGPIVPDSDTPGGARPALRYAYGARDPAFERSVASLAPVEMYELPRTVTLEPDRATVIPFVESIAMPIRRFYVYDGVRFDRFQRNRRTDWNYGTEHHTVVQTHVEFDNEEKFGLGLKLPPGMCRLFQVRADGSVDLIGEEALLAVASGMSGHVRVGPAVGLTGARERTGYVEVKPHHVYEESFQVRLANTSDETAEIRVVEHLYRWPEFEIIRADTDYTTIGPQSIEFRVELRPGGRRTIHYTVRYTW